MARKTRSSTATERVKRVAAFPPTMATCPALLLKAGAAGLCAGARPITRLKRNPGRLRRAVRPTETGIADEHLTVAAIGAARRSLQLRGNLIRGMAQCDGQKCDKASRRADGRQNAFRSDQGSVCIGGD